MKTLFIDLETYSETNIKTHGLYRYVADPAFEVLLFAYKYKDGSEVTPTRCIDLANLEDLPEEVVQDIFDPNVLKSAYNAPFEIECLSKHFDRPLNPAQWTCTMKDAAYHGLPMGLDAVGRAMRTAKQKDRRGGDLIRFFCVPCKPTRVNEWRSRNLPEHAPAKWNDFIEYCIQDVETEFAVRDALPYDAVTPTEKEYWLIDQAMNARGILADRQFINAAIAIDDQNRKDLIAEAVAISGLDKPNSLKKLTAWLTEELDQEITSLKKDNLPGLIKSAVGNDEALRMLNIRAELSKTSITKYKSMLKYMSDKDDRIRGIHQFGGAVRTMRWAGRGVQPQNMKRNDVLEGESLEMARELVRAENLDAIRVLFGDVSMVLSELTRTAFISGLNKMLVMADYSAIEARVLAWLAGEKWRMEVFATHGKIYEASAAAMFDIDIDKIVEGNPEYYYRKTGKVAELALGYQGWYRALVNMGAVKRGLCDDAIKAAKVEYDLLGGNLGEMIEEAIKGVLVPIVKKWRAANARIVRFWALMDSASKRAFKAHGASVSMGSYRDENGVWHEGKLPYGIKFKVTGNTLRMRLPSGRSLSYWNAKLITVPSPHNPNGKEVISYEGLNTMSGKWETQFTYGGKLVENATQAVARDAFAIGMAKLKHNAITMLVHDEIVAEANLNIYGELSRDYKREFESKMSEPIAWAPGLILGAKVELNHFYKK